MLLKTKCSAEGKREDGRYRSFGCSVEQCSLGACRPPGVLCLLVNEGASSRSPQGACSCESKSMAPTKKAGGRRARKGGGKYMVSLGSQNQRSPAGDKEPGSRNCVQASLRSGILQKPRSPCTSVQPSTSWDPAAPHPRNWWPSPHRPWRQVFEKEGRKLAGPGTKCPACLYQRAPKAPSQEDHLLPMNPQRTHRWPPFSPMRKAEPRGASRSPPSWEESAQTCGESVWGC